MGTVVTICLIGFQLVAGTDMLDLLKFLSFLISALTHVYFISIFGTEMMTLVRYLIKIIASKLFKNKVFIN